MSDFGQWLRSVQNDELAAGQIAFLHEDPPVEAQFDDDRPILHPRIEERLQKKGMQRLYEHQSQAIGQVLAGKDTVVVSATASGKSLCYVLPTLQICVTEPVARAMFLFPTKALAQDQLGKLQEFIPGPDVRAGTYDGDTPVSRRASLRRLSHILLTNPDMLHMGVLPNHEQWTPFLKSLRIIVLDEIHVYRGVFGSHVGGILRRLLRLCEWHGSHPVVVACSATIGNPGELFKQLTGRDGQIVDNDGAPRGKRTFAFWNPPKISDTERMSANAATGEILTDLVETEVRTLAFCRARGTTELVLRRARERLRQHGQVDPEKIESYRAGYTAKERREIEQGLFRGKLLGLVATNAMELGVDVGGLDAVIMNGYPGTIASFWQQAGRAGRAGRDGLAILVAHDDPLEQFMIREPERLLQSAQERVSANPENPQILSDQLKCAAFERPLGPSELPAFGNSALERAEILDRSGELQFRAGRFFYPSHESPSAKVNIRGSGGAQITLLLDGRELGNMERWRALEWAHKGAVYLHRGTVYLVRELDLEQKVAHLIQVDVDYFTQPIVQSIVEVRVEIASRKAGKSTVDLCGVSVTDLVIGYKKKAMDGGHVLAVEDLDLPPDSYETIAVKVDLPSLDLDRDIPTQIAGVHGLEHCLMAVAPLLAGCDRGDLGSAWYAVHHDTGTPSVFIFDKTPGGVGLCENLFRDFTEWSDAAHTMLTSCKCTDGCPACLLSPRCSMGNEALSKPEAGQILLQLRS